MPHDATIARRLPPARLAAIAQAQTAWPNRSVRITPPGAPGSAPDVAACQVAEPLNSALGQSFIVENRLGAGGNIRHGYVTPRSR